MILRNQKSGNPIFLPQNKWIKTIIEFPPKVIVSVNSNIETYERTHPKEDQYDHSKEILRSSFPQKHKGDFS